jgi:hypothetical protein
MVRNFDRLAFLLELLLEVRPVNFHTHPTGIKKKLERFV